MTSDYKRGLGLACALVGALALSSSAWAAGAEGDAKQSVKPVLIQPQDGRPVMAGVKYDFSGKLAERSFDAQGGLDPDALRGGVDLTYRARGTVASSAERNPENLLDFALDLKGLASSSAGAVKFGASLKYEADQKFKNHNLVYGAKVTAAKNTLLFRNDQIALDIAYSQVDPGKDDARKKALGVETLDKYYRGDLEALYRVPVAGGIIRAIELNYRLYREFDAPAAIKAAKLNKHELSTIRLDLPKDFFVAYSTGKLPFDRKDDQAMALGWSYKLF